MKLLIGGSPCQKWSIAQTNNRETTAEGIGWELFKNYVIARDKYKPDYFLYENNKSMSPAIRQQITAELGVEPVLINSALVSAQNRQRLYWVGKRNADGKYEQVFVEQPQDKGLLLKDILDNNAEAWQEKSYCLTTRCMGAIPENTIVRKQHTMVAEPLNPTASQKGRSVTAGYKNKGISPSCIVLDGLPTPENPAKQKFDYIAEAIDYTPRKGSTIQINENGIRCVQPNGATCAESVVRVLEQPAGALISARPTKILQPIRIGEIENDAQNQDFDSRQYRVYSPEAKSVTLCGNGGGAGAKTGLYIIQSNGKTKQVPVYQVRNGFITIKDKEYPIKLTDGDYIIRKLTVNECKRLQTVPDWYEFPVSKSQAYKMLGNGWTIDVISHIMSHFEDLQELPVEVLSMYDGMAGGMIALRKLGVTPTAYYATEIDKFAIKTALHNFPDIIQSGDAFQVRNEDWGL